MKKKTLLISGIVILSIMLMSVFLYKTDNQSSYANLIKSGSQIAMYLGDADGEYSISQDNKFPTNGYVLNTERSSCTNGGTLSQNPETKKIKVNVTDVDTCTLYFDLECPRSTWYNTTTLSNGLKVYDESATTYNKCNAGEMYTFRHDTLTTTTTNTSGTTTYTHSATQVADWSSEERKDYRYIGANPNNYVIFNGETWRIIGVFTVEREAEESESTTKEQLIKIIRNRSIGDITWDSGDLTKYSTEWSTSSLHDLLNDTYYNTEAPFDYIFIDKNDAQHTITIEKGLNEIARGQIAKVKWYLGGLNVGYNLSYQDYYNIERSETVRSGNSINIMQKVGLMYPSDYIYTYGKGIDEKCYTDGINCTASQGGTPSTGWLYNESITQWTQTPCNLSGFGVFRVNSTGTMGVYHSRYLFGVRPVVYLKSGIKIMDGDGSEDNPYTLGL